MEPILSAVEEVGELLNKVTTVLVASVPVSDFVVVIFDAEEIVTSVEAVDSLLAVVGTVEVCDELAAVEEDCEPAEIFVTSDVVCGSSVVEPTLSAVEDVGELLNVVMPVIIFNAEVMGKSVVSVDSVLSVDLTEVGDESNAALEDCESAE